MISFNTRGLKSNIDYVRDLCHNNNNFPLVLCLSEHWLHSYDLHVLSTISDSFQFNAKSEDDVYIPRLIRGKGGVAILWSKILDPFVTVISQPCNDQIIGIRLRYESVDL